ncbi:MAG: M48 family metalloprotease [Cyanothece sp. SIO2G6]|nr:M48 family metalloprotease [Cyanothece sp. SIO2G6]
MKYTPKEITEEVNVTPTHPLVNLGYLAGTVVVSLVAIYAAMGVAVDLVVPRLSRSTEIKIGDSLLPVAQDQFGGNVLADDTRVDYLESLAQPLIREELSDLPITIHLMDTEIANAAIIAGGHVFVTTGLLEESRSENELVFILGHELGHLANRDSLKSLGRSLFLLLGSLALGIGTQNGQSSPLLNTTLDFQSLHYSREQETQADRYGMILTIEQYGHGGYALDFFERHSAHEPSFIPEYVLTHPLSENRIEALELFAAENNWSLTGDLVPLPEGIECPNFDCGNE